MTRFAQLFLLTPVVGLLACGADNRDPAYKEAAGHYLQAQHDYCSTNFFVAEQGLTEYRQWLSDTNHPCEPWFNRDENLFQVDARLFVIKEALGETNKADFFCREAEQAYSRFLQAQHLPPRILSKEEVREQLARQEKGLDVGWKKGRP